MNADVVRKPLVLICDDEQAQFEKLRKCLESEGFQCAKRVDTHDGAAEMLRKAQKERSWYQLVMIDLDLRGSGERMSGIQVYEALCRDHPDETYVLYTRHDADKFRAEISRLRFREVSLLLLEEVNTQERLRLQLTRILDPVNPTRVFLVCGRNGGKNERMKDFLETGLGLQVIDWEQAKVSAGTDYTFEIVVAGIKMSNATVVLFTDDEEVTLRKEFRKEGERPETKAGRAVRRQSRPNVYVEAGYARGLRQKRTIFVEWPDRARDFEAPSDFAGIHTVRLSADGKSRVQLAERLEAARCLLKPRRGWRTMAL